MSSAHAIDAFGVAWRLGATGFFVALNGFFVATEFSLIKVRAVKLEELARGGSSAARSVLHIQKHLDRYLSACQLGITLASLILGALGEPAVSVLLLAGLRATGLQIADDAAWVPVVSLAIAFLTITALHMTVGEQAPKMWALHRPETTALWTARPLRWFAFVFGPFIVVINAASNWMLRMAGLPGGHLAEGSHTADEIRAIMALSAHAGQISARQFQMTENVFRLIELEVRHIVVPRVDVVFLLDGDPIEESLRLITSCGHSRLPLCERGLDSVVGLVHSRDVLEVMVQGGTPDLRQLAREPVFVPDTMPISNFLLELQAKRQHCAVVIDEHGTAMGLAFREDALEEIVGPLGDEFDEEQSYFEATADGALVSGRVPLPEVCARLEFTLPIDEDEGEETIGGQVTARLGRLARVGDEVALGPFHAVVLEVARRRIHRLRLERRPADTADPSDAAEG